MSKWRSHQCWFHFCPVVPVPHLENTAPPHLFLLGWCRFSHWAKSLFGSEGCFEDCNMFAWRLIRGYTISSIGFMNISLHPNQLYTKYPNWQIHFSQTYLFSGQIYFSRHKIALSQLDSKFYKRKLKCMLALEEHIFTSKNTLHKISQLTNILFTNLSFQWPNILFKTQNCFIATRQ